VKRLRTIAAAVGALLIASGAQAVASPWGEYENSVTHMCMDVGSYAPRTPVIQYPCQHVTNGSQSWQSIQWGVDGDFIQNLGNPNMCLDIGEKTPGSPVLISWCHLREDYPSQKFVLTYRGNLTFEFRSLVAGLCLDVSSLPGTAVHLVTCDKYNPSQAWQF
jgi:hypothetical protein